MPPETRPARARRFRTPQGLGPLAGRMWSAVETATALLGHEDPAVRLRAVHAMSQAAGVALRLYEVVSLEAELAALEAQVQDTA